MHNVPIKSRIPISDNKSTIVKIGTKIKMQNGYRKQFIVTRSSFRKSLMVNRFKAKRQQTINDTGSDKP